MNINHEQCKYLLRERIHEAQKRANNALYRTTGLSRTARLKFIDASVRWVVLDSTSHYPGIFKETLSRLPIAFEEIHEWVEENYLGEHK